MHDIPGATAMIVQLAAFTEEKAEADSDTWKPENEHANLGPLKSSTQKLPWRYCCLQN